MNLVDRYQRAQQPATPVIGFLSGGSSAAFAPYLRAFWQGLGEAGFVDGRNIAIEYRWAEGRLDHLPEMAADLVRRQVALIAATPGRNRQTSLRCCCSIALDLMFNQGRFQPRKPRNCRGRSVHCSRPSVLTHGVIPGSSHTPALGISSPGIDKAHLMGPCNHGETQWNTTLDWTYR